MNSTPSPITATAADVSSSFEDMAMALDPAADRIEDAARAALDEIETQAARVADIAAALHELVVAEDLAALRSARSPEAQAAQQ